MDPRQSEAAARIVPDPEPSRTVCGTKLAHGVDVWRVTGNNSIAGEGRAERAASEPAMTVGTRSDLWRFRNGDQANACERGPDEPAGTLFFGDRVNDVGWVHTRPATTIVGSHGRGRVAPPGGHGTSIYEMEGSVPITPEEAAILQGFRPDYPFQGTKTSRFRQIGNAVPPLWAAEIIGALARVPLRLALEMLATQENDDD